MTAAWVKAAHAAMDAAAAGRCPEAELSGVDEPDRGRALGAALPIIEKAAWLSEKIMAEPSRQRRLDILNRHTAKNPGLRMLVETRVRRKWMEARR